MVGPFAQPVSSLFCLLSGNLCISLRLTDFFLQPTRGPQYSLSDYGAESMMLGF